MAVPAHETARENPTQLYVYVYVNVIFALHHCPGPRGGA
ncbi:Uncharacterised protein [Bordetella pertussis]|nr:Uncharacterised protein [Bordetella pertussis]